MSTQPDTTSVPRLDLNDGSHIPQLGFGVFQVPPEQTRQTVEQALETGYRHIDTAAAYKNEAEVGKAIAAAGIDREDLFITTKLWNNDQGRDNALRAFEQSLSRLGGDYVDLYLIHWPAPAKDLYTETWEAFTELKADGRARSIGVSNFRIEDLEKIIEATGVVPAVNQIELHPRLQQEELRHFHQEHGIVTEAWSPLGQGQFLDEATLTEIASAHDRTAAQVVLRWHLQLGNVVFPKSVTPERIQENFRLFDFELHGDEMAAIAKLDAGERTGPDPSTFA
jgi:2,5-diketo-D-gluconate reductase A